MSSAQGLLPSVKSRPRSGAPQPPQEQELPQRQPQSHARGPPGWKTGLQFPEARESSVSPWNPEPGPKEPGTVGLTWCWSPRAGAGSGTAPGHGAGWLLGDSAGVRATHAPTSAPSPSPIPACTVAPATYPSPSPTSLHHTLCGCSPLHACSWLVSTLRISLTHAALMSAVGAYGKEMLGHSRASRHEGQWRDDSARGHTAGRAVPRGGTHLGRGAMSAVVPPLPFVWTCLPGGPSPWPTQVMSSPSLPLPWPTWMMYTSSRALYQISNFLESPFTFSVMPTDAIWRAEQGKRQGAGLGSPGVWNPPPRVPLCALTLRECL